MIVLPPGTLLQLLYLQERLSKQPAGYFIEVGPGSGEVTKLLLDLGWSGASYDLEEKTVQALEVRFSKEIVEKRFLPMNEDFISTRHINGKADLLISCMVMEHLEEKSQQQFLDMAALCLNNTGIMVGIVPSSPAHWGIEDDIAGHCRRYTRGQISITLRQGNWNLRHIAGLTFPVSNLLLPLSNYLVNKSERSKLGLSLLDRTKSSGARDVKFKTHFPGLLAIVLNRHVMFPFHIIQKIFKNSNRALVLYFEATFDPKLSRND